MLCIVNFNAFIGRFADTALGAYRVWKGALKNKRLHKNKWFLNIIQTGINPTTPDLTGSTGFVTKNHKYFSPITSRICKCFIWQSPVFLRHPVGFIFPLKASHEKTEGGVSMIQSYFRSQSPRAELRLANFSKVNQLW